MDEPTNDRSRASRIAEMNLDDTHRLETEFAFSNMKDYLEMLESQFEILCENERKKFRKIILVIGNMRFKFLLTVMKGISHQRFDTLLLFYFI